MKMLKQGIALCFISREVTGEGMSFQHSESILFWDNISRFLETADFMSSLESSYLLSPSALSCIVNILIHGQMEFRTCPQSLSKSDLINKLSRFFPFNRCQINAYVFIVKSCINYFKMNLHGQ
jgi:hypothetical protein